MLAQLGSQILKRCFLSPLLQTTVLPPPGNRKWMVAGGRGLLFLPSSQGTRGWSRAVSHVPGWRKENQRGDIPRPEHHGGCPDDMGKLGSAPNISYSMHWDTSILRAPQGKGPGRDR